MPARIISMMDFEEAEARVISDANQLLAMWLGPVEVSAIDYEAAAVAIVPERKQRAKQPQRSRRKQVRVQSNR